MRNIFIVALRRSGTTVFWESFRRCSDSTCYDEPFNPRLYSLPRPHHRGTWNELINKFNLSPRSFKEHFSPIEHNDEFNTELSVSQSTYLKYLIRGSEPVVIDFTRCNFRISALKMIDPDAVLVHLYRCMPGFVSSHIVPSYKSQPKFKLQYYKDQLKDHIRKFLFWTSWVCGDSYGYGSVFESDCFRHRADDLGLILAVEKAKTAAEKLALVWRLSYLWVESRGSQIFGDNFVSVSFEDFVAAPERTIGSIATKAGIDLDMSALPKISQPNLGRNPAESRWRDLDKLIHQEQ